jgi:uncharacterized phage-associated protein
MGVTRRSGPIHVALYRCFKAKGEESIPIFGSSSFHRQIVASTVRFMSGF